MQQIESNFQEGISLQGTSPIRTLTFKNTYNGEPVIGQQKFYSFISPDGQRLITDALVIDIAGEGTETLLGYGGGASWGASINNINPLTHLARGLGVKKLIISTSNCGAARQADFNSGAAMIKAICESDDPLIRPSGTFNTFGYSTGSNSAMGAIAAAQNNTEWVARFGEPKRLVLAEPVGLTPNKDLAKQFGTVPGAAYNYAKEVLGLDSKSAILYAWQESVKRAWCIAGDNPTTLRNIIGDAFPFGLKAKRHLRDVYSACGIDIKTALNIEPPLKELMEGNYRELAQSLRAPLNVALLLARNSLCPIMQNAVKANKDDNAAILRDIRTNYGDEVFPNVGSLLVRTLQGGHSLVQNPPRFGEVTAAISSMFRR